MADSKGNAEVDSGMIYGIDDKPPMGTSFFVGLEHVLMTFGINITVPLLIGPRLGMSPAQMSILIGAVLATSGITTFLQANSVPAFRSTRGLRSRSLARTWE